MRVAFVTTRDQAAIHDDVDLPLQEAAFAAAGSELQQVAWEDGRAEWDTFDLVVFRSPWNYVDRLDDFRGWLQTHLHQTQFHNPVALIQWNLDKRYLASLADRGVSVVPTCFVETLEEFREVSASIETVELVVKPTISAGSRMTGRFRVGDRFAEQLVIEILDCGLTVMVQPFASRVDSEGEIGTVVFDGEISHSFRKAALLDRNGVLVGGSYREEISAAELGIDERELVERARDTVTSIAREQRWIGQSEHLLYGRYDLIRLDDGSPALLEAELFEPCFFLPTAPEAADRFVRAVADRVR